MVMRDGDGAVSFACTVTQCLAWVLCDSLVTKWFAFRFPRILDLETQTLQLFLEPRNRIHCVAAQPGVSVSIWNYLSFPFHARCVLHIHHCIILRRTLESGMVLHYLPLHTAGRAIPTVKSALCVLRVRLEMKQFAVTEVLGEGCTAE